ncbi:uncharacterized protein LOC142586949 [Dermacentor variabilis]|uniref:uncharacterized protein LOC142586949 n=1 Tax=Dermacentor variabilis TaxID=34621 RepID=UPI003F5C8C37
MLDGSCLGSGTSTQAWQPVDLFYMEVVVETRTDLHRASSVTALVKLASVRRRGLDRVHFPGAESTTRSHGFTDDVIQTMTARNEGTANKEGCGFDSLPSRSQLESNLQGNIEHFDAKGIIINVWVRLNNFPTSESNKNATFQLALLAVLIPTGAYEVWLKRKHLLGVVIPVS